MDGAQFQFESVEDVLTQYPFFITAALHTVRPLPRGEVLNIFRAQMQTRGAYVPNQHKPADPNQLDYIELRGTKLLQNGASCAANDTGPIYINHSYDPASEMYQDFVDGDLVTILYQNINFEVAGQYRKPVIELHPVAIYSHETRVMVQCKSDFSNRSYDIQEPKMYEDFAHRAAGAIIFFWENNIMPQNGRNSRPVGDAEFIVYYDHRKPPQKSSFSCLNVIALLALIFGALWLFLALVSAFGK